MNDAPEFMTHDRIMTGEEYVSYSDYLLLKKERDEALMDRNNGDIATMTRNHYERILRERDEAREESLEQARLLGISGERECRIIAERDEARQEILGWENKWKAAVEMAALAENERDRLRERLTNTEDQLDCALICLRRFEGRLTESEP
jgi:hypothetical protein